MPITPRPRKTYSQISPEVAGNTPASGTTDSLAEFLPSFISSGGEETERELDTEIAASNKNELASEFAFLFQTIDKEGYIPTELSSGNSIDAGSGSVTQLLIGSMPATKKGRIKRALEHYGRDDLLGSLIDTKIDFTVSGLNLKVTPPLSISDKKEEQDKIEKLQEDADNISIGIDLDKLVDDLLRDYFITDSMVLYWRVEVTSATTSGQSSSYSVPADEDGLGYFSGIPGLQEICALNPSTIDWRNSLGQDVLVCDIQNSLRDQINDARNAGKYLKKTDAEIKYDLMQQGIGAKWIDAVFAGRDIVVLTQTDGDNWLIRTKSRKYYGLADPCIRKIFLSLELRKMLIEGDFTAAFMMKHFIQLVKQGESIDTGPLAGSTRNWLKPADATALLRRFSVVNKAMRAAVNHTTTIEFIFPPKEMFDGAKFEQCDLRIYNWAGITITLMTGDGANYGGGFLSVKRLIAQIEKARKELGLIFMKFFADPTISKMTGIPAGYRVAAKFDTSVLTEPQQLLDEVKTLLEGNAMDPRTALSELGRDPESIKANKLQSIKEQESLKVWGPVVEPVLPETGTGNPKLPGKPQGRPKRPGVTRSAETRTQGPKTGSSAKKN